MIWIELTNQPVGTGEIKSAQEVSQSLVTNGNIVSVGYMLRYLRCVQHMKKIIHDNNLTVMATNARYVCHLFPLTPNFVNRTEDSPPPTRQSPSQHGGTSLSIWDPSLSREPISVICPDTSVVMSRSTLSCTSPSVFCLFFADVQCQVCRILRTTRSTLQGPRRRIPDPRRGPNPSNHYFRLVSLFL